MADCADAGCDAFKEPGYSILAHFLTDLKKETGEEYFYLGGAEDLQVRTVSGPYRIEEYDGSESVIEPDGQVWW